MSINGEPGDVGRRLRQARLAAMLTLEELADSSGVSVRAISDLERGRTGRPFPRTVRLLASALDLPGFAVGELVATSRRAGFSVTAGQPERAGRLAPVASAQLPAGARDFGGRTAELTLLTSWLDEAGGSVGSVPIMAIGGSAGVGKTALALYWAHQIAQRFPDGQLYVNLRGFGPSGHPATPAQAVRGFLGALQVPSGRIPAGIGARAGLYRSMLAGRRMLIVLDNARDDAQVRPLLPACPSCLVIVTSRCQLAGLAAVEGAHLLTVDVLAESDARKLLMSRLGARRAAAEPKEVRELTWLCASLPLAVSIIAARAAARPMSPAGAARSGTARYSRPAGRAGCRGGDRRPPRRILLV